MQQLKNQFEVEVHYYADHNLELDYLIQHKGEILPIEVKAGEVINGTSLKNYIKTQQPTTAIRFSRLNYKTDGAITNIPLYLAPKITELITMELQE